jgi:hypothetical protein
LSGRRFTDERHAEGLTAAATGDRRLLDEDPPTKIMILLVHASHPSSVPFSGAKAEKGKGNLLPPARETPSERPHVL